MWRGGRGEVDVGVGVRWVWVGGTSKNETLIGFVYLKID